jgi:putative flippase GtrA
VALSTVTDRPATLPTRLIALARSEDGRRLFKYSLVSVISVAIGQAILAFCYVVLGWSGSASNVTAVCLSAVPSYLLNRYWAWQKRGPNHFWKEVVPYWSLALVGLLFSTFAVHYADMWWGNALAVQGASLGAFGVLWVAKFVLFNKVLFVHDPENLPPALDGRTGIPT